MNKTKNYLFLLFLVHVFFLSSCVNDQDRSLPLATESIYWEQQLESQIGLLGHRNWIVVADAAYPLQSNPGISTILSTDDHYSTIEKVSKLIEKQKHIKPLIYLDKEIDYVAEEDAPGIGKFNTFVTSILGDNAEKVIHEDIIRLLDEASALFNVVIVKTDFTIPYTSVFFQLDCKYWNAESEQKMRENMEKSNIE